MAASQTTRPVLAILFALAALATLAAADSAEPAAPAPAPADATADADADGTTDDDENDDPDTVSDEDVLAACHALQRGQTLLQRWAFARLDSLGARAHPLVETAFYDPEATPEGRRLLAHLCRLHPGDGLHAFLAHAVADRDVTMPVLRALNDAIRAADGVSVSSALGLALSTAAFDLRGAILEAGDSWGTRGPHALGDGGADVGAEALFALAGLIEASGFIGHANAAAAALSGFAALASDNADDPVGEVTTDRPDVLGLVAWRWQVAAFRAGLTAPLAHLRAYRGIGLAGSLVDGVAEALDEYRNAAFALRELTHRRFDRRERAERLLQQLTGDHPIVSLALLQSGSLRERRAAADALLGLVRGGRYDARPIVDAAVRALSDLDEEVRRGAQRLLLAIGPQDPLRFGALLPILPASVELGLLPLFRALPDAEELDDLVTRRKRLAAELPRLLFEHGLSDPRTADAYCEWLDVIAEWGRLEAAWAAFWAESAERFAPSQRSVLLRELESN